MTLTNDFFTKYEVCDRGLYGFRFKDHYKNKCSVQESSIATIGAIWLGVDEQGPGISYPTRMHLTQDQVKQLIPMLQYFVEHGRLP
jgi:hypothetical protein